MPSDLTLSLIDLTLALVGGVLIGFGGKMLLDRWNSKGRYRRATDSRWTHAGYRR